MSSCSILKKNLDQSDFFNSHMTGFMLYDPINNVVLHDWNADKYFTPASNTKLLSFYAGLKIMKDSIPGLVYQVKNDTLFFTSTGDPTFLHPAFESQQAFALLNDTTKKLVYIPQEFKDKPFADGWAWEDYQYYYQPERSPFPIYGNSISFIYDSASREFNIVPEFFQDFIDVQKYRPKYARTIEANIFSFSPDTARSAYMNRVPFRTSDELVIELLQDTLQKDIRTQEEYAFDDPDTVYNISSKEFYAYMLKQSDNFFAEQLLYLSATELGRYMDSRFVRGYMNEQYFKTAEQKPKWVDGSGLSRYNLMTPQFMIHLLELINEELTLEEMKQLLAIGGVDGTLSKWYQSEDGSPYVFAKTGTLSNNHNLTGIIRTQSGKDLFFSFMNNHYITSSAPVKEQMKNVLELIREKY